MTTTERETTTERGPRTGADGPASLTSQLAGCRDAEDYFRLLEVDYDPAVLSVNRLHILRTFGRELAELTAGTGAALSHETARDALRRSYQTFCDSTALDHRLFRVLQDHAPREVIGVDQIQLDPPSETPTAPPALRAVDAPLSVDPITPQRG